MCWIIWYIWRTLENIDRCCLNMCVKILWEVTCSKLIIAPSQHCGQRQCSSSLLCRQSCIIHCSVLCYILFCPPLIYLFYNKVTDLIAALFLSLFSAVWYLTVGTAAFSCLFITLTTAARQREVKVPTSTNQTREWHLTDELQEGQNPQFKLHS